MKTCVTRKILHFFFATLALIGLLRDYPEVLLMDCTYKTNLFGMPLLVIVIVSPLMKILNAAFAFLREKKEEDCAWALVELHKIYKRQLNRLLGPTIVPADCDQLLLKALPGRWPQTTHVFCIWHINKAVATNYKKLFETKEA